MAPLPIYNCIEFEFKHLVGTRDECDAAAALISKAGLQHRVKILLSKDEAIELLSKISDLPDLYCVGDQWYYKGCMVNLRRPKKEQPLNYRCNCGILLPEIDGTAVMQRHTCKCGRKYHVIDKRWKRRD